ncbi:uncharacterized protein V6R79_011941 [Siganus canaliculatus]
MSRSAMPRCAGVTVTTGYLTGVATFSGVINLADRSLLRRYKQPNNTVRSGRDGSRCCCRRQMNRTGISSLQQQLVHSGSRFSCRAGRKSSSTSPHLHISTSSQLHSSNLLKMFSTLKMFSSDDVLCFCVIFDRRICERCARGLRSSSDASAPPPFYSLQEEEEEEEESCGSPEEETST